MKIAMIIFAFNFLLALIGLFSFYIIFDLNTRNGGVIEYSDMLIIYTILSVIEFSLVLFIVPAITSSAISGEREKQTLEILLTTSLRPLQIIIGKLESSISTIILLMISSLPILSIVFTIGGISIKDLLQLMFLIVVTGIFVGSIGIFFSTLFKKTTISTIFTYGCLVLLILGTIAILGAILMVVDMNTNNNMNGTYQKVDLGNLILILLVNPAITLVSLFSNQFGSRGYLTEFLDNFGRCNEYVGDHWFGISVILQLTISAMLILWSAALLNPLKKSKKN